MTYQEVLEFINEHKAEYEAWMAAHKQQQLYKNSQGCKC